MHYSYNVNHNCCIILHPFIFILLIKQKKVSVEPAAESDEKKNTGSLMEPVRLAGSYRCWFVEEYCWLVCVREKYCSGWKFTIVYDKPRPGSCV